ncbi:hypothetical protein B0H15DRAFT_805200 [Mycena belliarum]|uniref:Uncharacterized protein n=1 Tax=Mycena belliarum TaxID=1033014 RepID=A0AAD6TU29_9AGAR|nr:hypothetical protein B0H15DRAFT_805200 [Mycena belliae]
MPTVPIDGSRPRFSPAPMDLGIIGTGPELPVRRSEPPLLHQLDIHHYDGFAQRPVKDSFSASTTAQCRAGHRSTLLHSLVNESDSLHAFYCLVALPNLRVRVDRASLSINSDSSPSYIPTAQRLNDLNLMNKPNSSKALTLVPHCATKSGSNFNHTTNDSTTQWRRRIGLTGYKLAFLMSFKMNAINISNLLYGLAALPDLCSGQIRMQVLILAIGGFLAPCYAVRSLFNLLNEPFHLRPLRMSGCKDLSGSLRTVHKLLTVAYEPYLLLPLAAALSRDHNSASCDPKPSNASFSRGHGYFRQLTGGAHSKGRCLARPGSTDLSAHTQDYRNATSRIISDGFCVDLRARLCPCNSSPETPKLCKFALRVQPAPPEAVEFNLLQVDAPHLGARLNSAQANRTICLRALKWQVDASRIPTTRRASIQRKYQISLKLITLDALRDLRPKRADAPGVAESPAK